MYIYPLLQIIIITDIPNSANTMTYALLCINRVGQRKGREESIKHQAPDHNINQKEKNICWSSLHWLDSGNVQIIENTAEKNQSNTVTTNKTFYPGGVRRTKYEAKGLKDLRDRNPSLKEIEAWTPPFIEHSPHLSASSSCVPPESYHPSVSAASIDAPLCSATSLSTLQMLRVVPAPPRVFHLSRVSWDCTVKWGPVLPTSEHFQMSIRVVSLWEVER